MFESLVYDILFFAVPIITLICFAVSLFRYLHAKKVNKKIPDTFSTEEIKNRKILLIVFSTITGVFAAIVLGFIGLLFMAVAFM